MSIRSDIQGLAVDALIELFELHAPSGFGLAPFYFCNFSAVTGGGPKIGGVEYMPLPIEVDGFDLDGRGGMPRPIARLANIDGVFSALAKEYDDLTGWKFVRRRTFAKYIDGGAQASNPDFFPDDVFYVEQKREETNVLVEWELVSALDLEGETLPTRRLTIYCGFEYRKEDCGYAGPGFTVLNQPTTDAKLDVCNKQLSGCKCRHGQYAVLPFGGFVGMRRFIA